MRRYVGTVGPKGQVTLPVEVRRRLGIQPRDKVYIEVEDNKAVVRRGISSVLELYGSVSPLKEKLTDDEMSAIAHEEMAEEAMRNHVEGD